MFPTPRAVFLGQEPVAKVHNRSHPARQLIVAYEDQCTPENAAKMTSRIKRPRNRPAQRIYFLILARC